MRKTEHFELDRFMKWLFLTAPWIFGAFALLGVALPFLPDDGRPTNEPFVRGLAATCVLLFGCAAWFSWRVVRQLPEAAVSLDDEGIWKTVQQRETALVHWVDIAQLHERHLLQRLELLDNSGRLLMRLEYQLDDFPRLRSVVLARSALAPLNVQLGHTYAKGAGHHLFSIAALLGFTALGVYVWQIQPLLAAAVVLGVVGMGSREYLTTIYKVALEPHHLVLHWPGRQITLRREEIQSIEVSDLLVNYARHPQVMLQTTRSHRALSLRNLGTRR